MDPYYQGRVSLDCFRVVSKVPLSLSMAALQQRQVIATEDGVAVIDKQLIVDPESGVILEVEKAKMAVDTGDGIVVCEQQRVKGVRVPPAAVSMGGIKCITYLKNCATAFAQQ